jgi:hypothetical protein
LRPCFNLGHQFPARLWPRITYDAKANRSQARHRFAIPHRANAKTLPAWQTASKLNRFKRITLRCTKKTKGFGFFVASALSFIVIDFVHGA